MYALAAELPQLDPVGLVTRLENKLRSLEETRAALEVQLSRSRKDLADAEGRLGRPFDQQEGLDILRRKQAEIEAALIPAESNLVPEPPLPSEPPPESFPARGLPPTVHRSVSGAALGALPPGPGQGIGR